MLEKKNLLSSGRYLTVFGREKIHFIVYDDFKADTKGEFQKTLRFLGVSSDSERKFPTINGNSRDRNRAFWCFLQRPPQLLRRIIRPITSRRFRSTVGTYLLRLNAVEEPRPPMEPELRDGLQKEFAPEIDRLSALLGLGSDSMVRDAVMRPRQS